VKICAWAPTAQAASDRPVPPPATVACVLLLCRTRDRNFPGKSYTIYSTLPAAAAFNYVGTKRSDYSSNGRRLSADHPFTASPPPKNTPPRRGRERCRNAMDFGTGWFAPATTVTCVILWLHDRFKRFRVFRRQSPHLRVLKYFTLRADFWKL